MYFYKFINTLNLILLYHLSYEKYKDYKFLDHQVVINLLVKIHLFIINLQIQGLKFLLHILNQLVHIFHHLINYLLLLILALLVFNLTQVMVYHMVIIIFQYVYLLIQPNNLYLLYVLGFQFFILPKIYLLYTFPYYNLNL